MKNQPMRLGGAGVLVTLLVFLVYPALAGSRTSFSSATFSRNTVVVDCLPIGSCEDSQLEFTNAGSAGCSVGSGQPPNCSGGIGTENGVDSWWIISQLFFWGPPYMAPAGAASTGMTVEGIRVSPEVLELNGVIDAGAWDPSVELEPGPVELSVFRFAGDPNVFDGVEVTSVTELVTLGLIQADDILFQEVHTYEVEDDLYYFGGSVDVTDLPSDEIVVFVAESDVSFTSSAVIPTSSLWGVALLVVLVLSVATWRLRRRSA